VQGPSSRWRQQNEGAARSALPLERAGEQVEANQGLDRMEVLTEHTDPLTEENTAALLLSSYCVQTVFCAYFCFAFIYYISCHFLFWFVSFFLFFFLFFSQHVTAVERLGTPGRAVAQRSLRLAAAMEAQLSSSKAELPAPTALQRSPSEEKVLLFRHRC